MRYIIIIILDNFWVQFSVYKNFVEVIISGIQLY